VALMFVSLAATGVGSRLGVTPRASGQRVAQGGTNGVAATTSKATTARWH
jgi:hypothetical protein